MVVPENSKDEFDWMSEWPAIHVLSSPWRHHSFNKTDDEVKPYRCAWCFNLINSSKRCSVCRQIYYCGSDCQRKDWTFHRHECKPFRRADVMDKSNVVHDMESRLLGRFVIASRLLGNEGKYLEDGRSDEIDVTSSASGDESAVPTTLGDRKGDWWGLGFKDLSSLNPRPLEELDGINSSVVIEWQCARMKFRTIYQYSNVAKISDDDLWTLFIIQRQFLAFITVANPDMDPEVLGIGLYPNTFQFAHSCDPDVTPVFDGPWLKLRLTKEGARRKASTNPASLTVDHQMIGCNIGSGFHVTMLQEEKCDWLSWAKQITCTCRICKDTEQQAVQCTILTDKCSQCYVGYLCAFATDQYLTCSVCKSR